MLGLCKELGILVVAEGVETPAENDALVHLGCDLLLGFPCSEGRARERSTKILVAEHRVAPAWPGVPGSGIRERAGLGAHYLGPGMARQAGRLE